MESGYSIDTPTWNILMMLVKKTWEKVTKRNKFRLSTVIKHRNLRYHGPRIKFEPIVLAMIKTTFCMVALILRDFHGLVWHFIFATIVNKRKKKELSKGKRGQNVKVWMKQSRTLPIRSRVYKSERNK